MSEDRETRYLNSDLDLQSREPLAHLCQEFDSHRCCILNQTLADDGIWYVTIENRWSEHSTAEQDILGLLAIIPTLSPIARQQWESCHFRDFNIGDFNIGFDCGDTWAYPHMLSVECVRAIAEAGCSVSVTLYPLRDSEEKATSG